jgi:hypothetical protein
LTLIVPPMNCETERKEAIVTVEGWLSGLFGRRTYVPPLNVFSCGETWKRTFYTVLPRTNEDFVARYKIVVTTADASVLRRVRECSLPWNRRRQLWITTVSTRSPWFDMTSCAILRRRFITCVVNIFDFIFNKKPRYACASISFQSVYVESQISFLFWVLLKMHFVWWM